MKKLIMLCASLSLALTILVHALFPIDYKLNNAVDYAPLVTVEAYSLTDEKAVDVEGNYIYTDEGIFLERGYYYELTFKNDTMIKAIKLNNNKVVKNY